MMITDALSTAEDVTAVYALLCAYFEAVHGSGSGRGLPDSLTRLPLDGYRDLTRRYAESSELYARCLGETDRHDPLLAEISDVAGIALQRLDALELMMDRAA